MVAPVDEVAADEWRRIFEDPHFLALLRDAARSPRTHFAPGLFLVFREIGDPEVRYSRVYEHDASSAQSATELLYEEIPGLYSDPILFLIDARSAEGPAPRPSHQDLHGLLAFVSAKGFTQMPLGLWAYQADDDAPIALFLAQWRGYPTLDQWEAVEAAFEASAEAGPQALADALNATRIVRAHIDAVPPHEGTLGDLAICDLLAYELTTYGEPGGGFMTGPAR